MKTLRGLIVLCHLSDRELLLSRGNTLVVYNLTTKKQKTVYRFPASLKSNWLTRHSNVLRRLLRSDVRMAFLTSQRQILAVYEGYIYQLCATTFSLQATTKLPRGSRPLNLTELRQFPGFEDGIYFGEYFSNPDKESCHIYRYQASNLRPVYTFAAGKINHIHHLVPDPFNNCCWILAGDFEQGAAIYRAANNFSSVVMALGGQQKYRSCVAFPTVKGLLYATDSQFEPNHIRLLSSPDGGEQWRSEVIYPINGPCIFGTQVGADFYFSTSVEAINSGGSLQKWTRRQSGPGIKKDRSEIVAGNLEAGFSVIYQNDKDWLPFLLFQFGNILFPSGVNTLNQLIFSNLALKSADCSTQIIDL